MNLTAAKREFVTQKEFQNEVCCIRDADNYLVEVVPTPVGGGIDLTFTLRDGTVIGPITIPTSGGSQTLSFTDPDLTISAGNTVDISDVNYWDELAGDLTYTTGNVGIGALPFVPSDSLHIESGNIRVESGDILIDGSTSGQLTLSAPAVAGSAVATFQNASGTVAYLSDIVGGDTDAIHDNVSGEIAAITEKVSPVNGDWLLIESVADGDAKRKVQIGNLPVVGGGLTIGDAIAAGAANRILFEDGSNQLAESADLVYTASSLELNRSTDGVFDLYLADDEYFHRGLSGEIEVFTNGTKRWILDSSSFGSNLGSGAELSYQTSGILDPYLSLAGDSDTGISGDLSNNLGIVSGGDVGIEVSNGGSSTNVELFGQGGSFGGSTAGQGVLRFNEAAVTPSGTFASGGGAYVSGNDLYYIAADGTITNLTDPSFKFTWTEYTGVSLTMNVNTGYVVNNAGLVSLSLPASASIGQKIKIVGKGAGGWIINQGVGQTTYFGDETTTTGVGGGIASTHQRDCIELICITTNSEWEVVSSIGNPTVT